MSLEFIQTLAAVEGVWVICFTWFLWRNSEKHYRMSQDGWKEAIKEWGVTLENSKSMMEHIDRLQAENNLLRQDNNRLREEVCLTISHE